MKTKRYSAHYSLEERMVEPFRAIRWISVPTQTRSLGILGLLVYIGLWWVFRGTLFQFWDSFMRVFIQITDMPWTVDVGYWPDQAASLLVIPKLVAGVQPPYLETWWICASGTIALLLLSSVLKPSFLPLRSFIRFMVFLLMICLICFAYAPLAFKHSVEEWSKIYFLGAYGSFLIYGIIWLFGVLWFPIPTFKKITVTIALVCFEVIAIPTLLLLASVIMRQSSLILLPLFALLISPILQLGWFVAFYSYALSSGSDPTKEVRLS